MRQTLATLDISLLGKEPLFLLFIYIGKQCYIVLLDEMLKKPCLNRKSTSPIDIIWMMDKIVSNQGRSPSNPFESDIQLARFN